MKKKVLPKTWSYDPEVSLFSKAMNSERAVFVVFDTETTGLDTDHDQICELAAIKLVPVDGHLEEVERMDLFMRPTVQMNPKAQEKNGLTMDFLSRYKTEKESFPKVESFFQNVNVFVAHNAKFDMAMLASTYRRVGRSLHQKRVVLDTMMLSKTLLPEVLADYHLSTLASYFGFADNVRFHNGLDDTEVTRKLLEVLYTFTNDYLSSRIAGDDLFRPDLYSVNYWTGPRHTMQRIYVTTSAGTVFYDIWNHCWKEKDAQIDQIDMRYLQSLVMKIEGFSDIEEMERIGRKRCSQNRQ